MASNLMLADERVLWMAQREALACSRIITCLQKIAVYRLATAQAFSLVSAVNNTMGPIFVAAQRQAEAAPQRLGIFTHTVSKTYCRACLFACTDKMGPLCHVSL